MHSNSSDLRKNSDTSLASHTPNNNKTDVSVADRISPFPNKFEKRRRRSRQKFTSRSIQLLAQRNMISRCLSLPIASFNHHNSDRNKNLINNSPTIKLLISKTPSKKFNSNKDLSSYSLSSLLLNKMLTRSNHFELFSSLKLKSQPRAVFDESNNNNNTHSHLHSSINKNGNGVFLRTNSNSIFKKNYQVLGDYSTLAFKRSFSVNDLSFNQKCVKRSSSFDKFIQNVVKGKQKSASLCTFNTSNTNINDSQVKHDQTAIYNQR